ncbi:MAG: S8 family serine peptidase [Myxococcota bacterium]
MKAIPGDLQPAKATGRAENDALELNQEPRAPGSTHAFTMRSGGGTPSDGVERGCPVRRVSADRPKMREYLLCVPREMRSGFDRSKLGKALDKQTDRQARLSCDRFNHYVMTLTPAEASRYREQGFVVAENRVINRPMPPVTQLDATDDIGGLTALGNDVHGFTRMNNELGMSGEGTKVVIVDSGLAQVPNLPRIERFFDAIESRETSPRDGNGHGTFCGGIVSAQGNDGRVVGAAPSASLSGARVLDDSGRGSTATILAALRRIIEWSESPEWRDHPVVVNMSLGGTAVGSRAQDPFEPLIREMEEVHGIMVCMAAGNDGDLPPPGGLGRVASPAWVTNGLSVAATDHRGTADVGDDRIAGFSSPGDPNGPAGQNDNPDISAAGSNVESLLVSGGVGRSSGTSFSSPFLAAASANLLGDAKRRFDAGQFELSPRDMVRQRALHGLLTETAADIRTEPRQFDGAGDLRAFDAGQLMLQRFGASSAA